jgi:hypothetical protein
MIMPGKKRVRMRGVKHTSKKLEEDLLDRSRALADNPGLLRPQCAGNCRKCHFDKTFKSIDSLQKIRNNPDALVKEAGKMFNDDITKAYAGTISLAAAGSVPLLASARLGDETVSYAVRGSVGADKLIGCQYYNDPKIRLLLYNQFIKKNDLYLYSFEDTMVCSDKFNMPEDYLYDTFWETPYEFPDDGLCCGHETSAMLEIEVKSLGETIRICENCAKNISTIQFLLSRMAGNDPLKDLSVRVRHKFHAEGEKDYEEITDDKLKDYMIGKVTDSSLIGETKRSKLGVLRENATATYIVGTKNYGSSLDDFLGDIAGDEKVIEALSKFLSENPRTIIIKNPKVTDVLGAVWEEDWKGIVAAYTDEATAEKMADQSKSQPLASLESAHNIYISASVVDALPVFNKPGPMTTIADSLAKAAKVGGEAMVVKTIQNTGLKNNKARSLAAAFVMATGASEMPIKLSKEEKDFADYLLPFAKNVVAANGDKYRDSMNTLLTASGSGEKV